MADWYKIEAKAKDQGPAKIFVYDMIGEGFFDEGVSARAFVGALEKIDNPAIEMHINSPGGNFFDAVAIYNALRRHSANITSMVDGVAASAASLVALGGNEVVMGPGSQMMIHEASGIAMGQADEMRALADRLDKINVSMAGMYAAKAGGKADDWRKPMKTESWYTAQEAVDEGLADRVEAFEVPPEVQPQASFDLSRYRFAGRDHAPQPVAIAKRKPPDLPVDQPSTGAEPPVVVATGSSQTEGAGHMAQPDLAKLREAINALGDDASEEEVRAAVAAAGLSTAPPAPQATATPSSEDLDQLRKDAGGTGVVMLDAGKYEDLEARLAGLEAFKAQAKARERDEMIDAAITDGRIVPANRPTWVANWDANPEGTKRLIAQLTPGLVPMAELGYGSDLDGDEIDGMPAEFAGLWPRKRGA